LFPIVTSPQRVSHLMTAFSPGEWLLSDILYCRNSSSARPANGRRPRPVGRWCAWPRVWLTGCKAAAPASSSPATVFAASGASNLVLRASQLGVLKLEFFHVHPQYLNGLLTVTEGHQLESVAQLSPAQHFVFSANDPAGLKFTRLAAQTQRGKPLRPLRHAPALGSNRGQRPALAADDRPRPKIARTFPPACRANV